MFRMYMGIMAECVSGWRCCLVFLNYILLLCFMVTWRCGGGLMCNTLLQVLHFFEKKWLKNTALGRVKFRGG